MNPRRRRRLALVLLVALAAAAAACGDDAQPVEVGSGSGGDASLQPDDVVVSVEVVGAFTTPEWTFQNLPSVVVYGDGTRLSLGPQTMIYPGAAVPSVLQDQLSDDDVAALIAAARDAGLDRDDVDYGQPPVADAGDTVVTLTLDGETYVHRATALGLVESDAAVSAQLTEAQREARTGLADFVSEVLLAAPAGEVDAYAADRFRLWVRPADEVDTGAEEDGMPGPRTTDWTVDSIRLEPAECLAVEGDAVVPLAALLAEADSLTRFDDGTTRWAVVARPVLPHEPTCPDA